MHGGEEGDGRHCGGTDLDGDAGEVGQDGVGDVAEQADRGRTDQKAPEEMDRSAVIPRRDFGLGESAHRLTSVNDCERVLPPTNTTRLASAPSADR